MHTVVYDHQIFSLQQYGGISRYFCELASGMQRTSDFQAHVVGGLHFNTHLADTRVPRSAAYARMKVPRTGRLYRATNALLSQRLLRAARPSLIHRTYYRFSEQRLPGVPVVVTVFDMIHELFASTFPAGDTTSRDKRLAVRNADHVLCISESTARDLTELFGVRRDKISVTHLGLSDAFAAKLAAAEQPPHLRPYLLYVGQRAGYKNFEAAVQAYAGSTVLRNEFDLMAFGGPPFNARESALQAELGLRAGSVFHRSGPDDELARAYRHARAFVYPSRYEGFGIPPLEAMACGCPVACANTSSLPEVVGSAALLFDPDDLESMRRALESVAADDTARARLIAGGHAQAKSFSWDRCASETITVYRKLLAVA
jgi:glycosyltransferase involved in cell wall biosynthesis